MTTIEIKRTVTITREESIEVDVDIPDHILDDEADPDELADWVGAQMKIDDSQLSQATKASWDVLDEDPDYEIEDVTVLD